jgi:hypothetical protein
MRLAFEPRLWATPRPVDAQFYVMTLQPMHNKSFAAPLELHNNWAYFADLTHAWVSVAQTVLGAYVLRFT